MLNSEVNIEYYRSSIVKDYEINKLEIENTILMRILNEEQNSINKIDIGYLIGYYVESDKSLVINNNFLLPSKLEGNKLNVNLETYNKVEKNNQFFNLKGNTLGYYLICDDFQYWDKQTIYNLLNFCNKRQISSILILSRLFLKQGNKFPFKFFILSEKINNIFYKFGIHSKFKVNYDLLNLNIKSFEDIFLEVPIMPIVNPIMKKFLTLNEFEVENNVEKEDNINSNLNLLNENLETMINSLFKNKTSYNNKKVDNYWNNIFNKLKNNEINKIL